MSNTSLFGDEVIEDRETIKTVSYDEETIIRSIIRLYCPEGIELDPTYSVGNFYKHLDQPKFKYDLEPQISGVLQADCRQLPHGPNTVTSIMFDPPFVIGIGKNGTPGIIRTRFSSYRTIEELWSMYRDALKEFYRILRPNGILIFKCQDTIDGGKQKLSHVEIINSALKLGFYPLDFFILLARNRIVDVAPEDQQHARKFHSYFVVFKKTPCKVSYSILVEPARV